MPPTTSQPHITPDIGGTEYVFYSDKSSSFLSDLVDSIAERLDYSYTLDPDPEYDVDKFFFKNEDMYELHLEEGFNTKMNGQGGFWKQVKRDKIFGLATLEESFIGEQFDPHTINLYIDNISMIHLTVPDIYQDCQFSKMIYSMLTQGFLHPDKVS